MDGLYKDFISKLEIVFGHFKENRKSFKKTSNSEIARELCISDSQFSRLVNESATEGEYQRAIKNVDRLIGEHNAKEKLEKLADSEHRDGIYPRIFNKLSAVLMVIVVAILLTVVVVNLYSSRETDSVEMKKDEMLRWVFENSAIVPFLKLDDLPDDCNIPCYKYQGKWNLKNTYKIPFVRERNGFHYIAKSVNLYARCNLEEPKSVNLLEGYEYQYHEIWYDKKESRIDSFLDSDDRTKTTDDYKNLKFEESPNFIRVAEVHTFFRNEFRITSNSINRSGEVIGREAILVSDENLLPYLETITRVKNVKSEVNSIISNRLQDFSRPVTCRNSALPNANYHNIEESDEMSFDCQLTTANAPIGYTKTYVLNKQYIQTVCRPKI